MSRHLIDELIFDISFNATDTFLQEENYLQEVLVSDVLPMLDQVLTEFDQPGMVITLDMVELDLGDIDSTDLLNQMVNRLRDELRNYLQALRLDSSDMPSANVRQVQRVQAHSLTELDRLQFFLQYGRLPWHLDIHQIDEHERLLQQVLSQHATALMAWLQSAIRQPLILRRLLQQFSPARLLTLLSHHVAVSVDELEQRVTYLIALLQRYPCGEAARLRGVEQLWRELLVSIVQTSAKVLDWPGLINRLVSAWAESAGCNQTQLRNWMVRTEQELGGGGAICLFSPSFTLAPEIVSGLEAGLDNIPRSVSAKTAQSKSILTDTQVVLAASTSSQSTLIQRKTQRMEALQEELSKTAKTSTYKHPEIFSEDRHLTALFSVNTATLHWVTGRSDASGMADNLNKQDNQDILSAIERILARLQGIGLSNVEREQQFAALYMLIQDKTMTAPLRAQLILCCSDTTFRLLLRLLDVEFSQAITLPLRFRRIFQQALGMTDGHSWQHWRVWFWHKILDLIQVSASNSFDLIQQGGACLRSLAGGDVRQYQCLLTAWKKIMPLDASYAAFAVLLESEEQRNASLLALLPSSEAILHRLDLLDGVQTFIRNLSAEQNHFPEIEEQLYLMRHILGWLGQQDVRYIVQLLRQVLDTVPKQSADQVQLFGQTNVPPSSRHLAFLLQSLVQNLLGQASISGEAVVDTDQTSGVEIPVLEREQEQSCANVTTTPLSMDPDQLICDLRNGLPLVSQLSCMEWLEVVRHWLKTQVSVQASLAVHWQELATAIEQAANDASNPVLYLQRVLGKLMTQEILDLDSLHSELEEKPADPAAREAALFVEPSVDAVRMVTELRKGTLFITALHLSATQWLDILRHWMMTAHDAQFLGSENQQELLSTIEQAASESIDPGGFLQSVMRKLVAQEILDLDSIQKELESLGQNSSQSPSLPAIHSDTTNALFAVAHDITSRQVVAATEQRDHNGTATTATQISGASLLSQRDLMDLCRLWLAANDLHSENSQEQILRVLEHACSSQQSSMYSTVLEQLLHTASGNYLSASEKNPDAALEPLHISSGEQERQQLPGGNIDFILSEPPPNVNQRQLYGVTKTTFQPEMSEKPFDVLHLYQQLLAQVNASGSYPASMIAKLNNTQLRRLITATVMLDPLVVYVDRAVLLHDIDQYANGTSDQSRYFREVLHALMTHQPINFDILSATTSSDSDNNHTEITLTQSLEHVLLSLEHYLQTGVNLVHLIPARLALLQLWQLDPEQLKALLRNEFAQAGTGARSDHLINALVTLPEGSLSRILLLLAPQVHASLHDAADTVCDAFSYIVRHQATLVLQQRKWRFIFTYLMIRQLPFVRELFIAQMIDYLSQRAGSEDESQTKSGIDSNTLLNDANHLSNTLGTENQYLISLKVAARIAQFEQMQEPLNRTVESSQAAPATQEPFEYSSVQRMLAEQPEPTEEIFLINAGMVLAAPYLPRLFSVLELTADGQFVDELCVQRAVHVLQFLVSGRSAAPEYQLVLNKLLCGIKTAMPIAADMTLTQHECDVVESLLTSMIQNWKSIGNTTISGLRESFLQRPGMMRLIDDAWQLRVQGGVFDMLLDRLPWSFSIIKYPWMERPVHVTWR